MLLSKLTDVGCLKEMMGYFGQEFSFLLLDFRKKLETHFHKWKLVFILMLYCHVPMSWLSSTSDTTSHVCKKKRVKIYKDNWKIYHSILNSNHKANLNKYSLMELTKVYSIWKFRGNVGGQHYHTVSVTINWQDRFSRHLF